MGKTGVVVSLHEPSHLMRLNVRLEMPADVRDPTVTPCPWPQVTSSTCTSLVVRLMTRPCSLLPE